YRKRPTLRVRYWLIGWCLILVHFSGLMLRPVSPLGHSMQDFLVLGSLLLGGIFFILSTSLVRSLDGRWLAVLAALAIPWLAAIATACFLPEGNRLLPISTIAGEASTLLVAWRLARTRRALFVVLGVSIAGCTGWLVYGMRLHHDDILISVMLTQVFGLLALLYSFDVSRYTAGVRTVVLSLYAWAAVWIAATAAERFLPALQVPGSVWNLPKYLAAVGMILTLLEEEIRNAEAAGAHYRMLFQSNPHPMWMYDTETLAFLQVNDAAAHQYGYTREEFLRLTIADIRPGEEFSRLTAELQHTCESTLNGPWRHQCKDGSFMLVDIASHQLEYHGRKVTFSLMQDVTERDRLHEQLVHQANHDILTGLPNRALLEDRMTQTIAYASRYARKAALLCIDLDRFKQINDTYGHAIGDVCLQEIGRRLSARVRAVDTVARTGGEEFTVLLHQIAEFEDAERVAADILRGLNEPYRHNGIEIDLTASVGIAVYPDHGYDPAQLWRDADTAMYRAKKSGGNQYVHVSQEISAATLEASELEKHLRRALKDGGLELHYQPQFTRDGQLCGLEALVRLRHPVRGLIYPDRFIPLAEESGLIVALGNWVLDECCRQSREWQDMGFHPVRIAFNVSPVQLTRFDFSSYVIDRLRHHRLPPSALEMEVTESTVMRNIGQVARQIDMLARTGIHFSVDDFGTGYSSLAHLHQLPVQTLKIDRSFVERLNEPNGTYAIVQAIVFLAHSLGLIVVAEGVEREDQLDRLWQLDCDRVQGYLLARPQPASAITSMLAERLRTPSTLFAGEPQFAQVTGAVV
ncbi:MAG: domain S-box/diguanylate cyclase protein, partial [Acidobacteriaceae bacterium]|nr:domain S-box/diguanylate cyclase protein [Acidobacteriaceae bacterium]